MPAKYGWLHMGDSFEFSHAFAFAVSRSELFSRETLFVFITHAYNYSARKFSHFAKKKHSWNQAFREFTTYDAPARRRGFETKKFVMHDKSFE